MSQIEVPSWVVRAAMNAEFCGKSMRDALAFGTDHDEEILHAAITAALGAWLAPESMQHRYNKPHADGGTHPWFHSTDRDLLRINEYYRDQYDLRTLYTLRQEKPE